MNVKIKYVVRGWRVQYNHKFIATHYLDVDLVVGG